MKKKIILTILILIILIIMIRFWFRRVYYSGTIPFKPYEEIVSHDPYDEIYTCQVKYDENWYLEISIPVYRDDNSIDGMGLSFLDETGNRTVNSNNGPLTAKEREAVDELINGVVFDGTIPTENDISSSGLDYIKISECMEYIPKVSTFNAHHKEPGLEHATY